MLFNEFISFKLNKILFLIYSDNNVLPTHALKEKIQTFVNNGYNEIINIEVGPSSELINLAILAAIMLYW